MDSSLWNLRQTGGIELIQDHFVLWIYEMDTRNTCSGNNCRGRLPLNEVFDVVVKLDALVLISFLTFAFIVHPNLSLCFFRWLQRRFLLHNPSRGSPTCVQYVNRRASNYLGYTREKTQGHDFLLEVFLLLVCCSSIFLD